MKMGPYELLGVLGRGGLSVVYRSQYADTGEVVAVKVLTAEHAANPVLLKRFRKEYTAACRI